MAGGGAAETALAEAFAEAACMFAMPLHAGRRPGNPVQVHATAVKLWPGCAASSGP